MNKNEIRFYRIRKGITQRDLAKAIGVSQQAVAKWEANKASVSLDLIQKVEKALGVRKEILFPELGQNLRSAKIENEILDEKMVLFAPFEVVFHFKSKRPSYWAIIDGKNHDRIIDILTTTKMENVWFETQNSMIVSINRAQIASFEIGRDFGSLPSAIIERQKIGENDPEAEKNGDDRFVRLFVEGFDEPFVSYPDTEDDGQTLMMILHDALGDFISQEEFTHFEYDHDDERIVYFRSEKFELIECPISAHEEYSKNMLRQQGATEEDVLGLCEEIAPKFKSKKKGKKY